MHGMNGIKTGFLLALLTGLLLLIGYLIGGVGGKKRGLGIGI